MHILCVVLLFTAYTLLVLYGSANLNKTSQTAVRGWKV